MHFLHMSWLNFKGQRAAFNFEEFILLDTAYPFVTLVFYCVMAGFAFGTADVTDWVIGNAFMLCTNTCLFSLGTCFVGERYYGRIRSIIVGKTSKFEIVLQKGFFAAIVSVATTLAGFALGCLVFKIDLTRIPWGSLLIVLIIAMFATMGLGMFLSVLGLISHQIHMISNVMWYVLLIFTGTNFPISQLPGGVQIISYLLPMTRSIVAARELVAGANLGQVRELLLGEITVAVLYLAIAAVVIKQAERIAIRKGTLELF